MLVPLKHVDEDEAEIREIQAKQDLAEQQAKNRAIADLLRNANDSCYCNERGFRQKLIDTLYKLGYYIDNESVYASIKEQG